MKKWLLIISLYYLSNTLYAQNITHEKRDFYHIDTSNTKIYWKCDIHNGYFNIKYGGLLFINGQPQTGAFVIPTASFTDLDIDKEKFETAHLIFHNTIKNEFLEVDKYPYAYFIIDKITHKKENSYEVTGQFTLHGISRSISFSANIQKQGDHIEFTSEKFNIDRSLWGILRLSPKNPVKDDENGWTVPDLVNIKIRFTAIKQ